jgi:hypothetical protein
MNELHSVIDGIRHHPSLLTLFYEAQRTAVFRYPHTHRPEARVNLSRHANKINWRFFTLSPGAD